MAYELDGHHKGRHGGEAEKELANPTHPGRQGPLGAVRPAAGSRRHRVPLTAIADHIFDPLSPGISKVAMADATFVRAYPLHERPPTDSGQVELRAKGTGVRFQPDRGPLLPDYTTRQHRRFE